MVNNVPTSLCNSEYWKCRPVRGSNAGIESPAPVVYAVVNSALFQSNSHISQMSPHVIRILRF